MSNTEKRKSFPALLEPMLAPSKLLVEDIPLSALPYPQLCSTKYNGIRACLMDGTFRSRTMSEHRIHPMILRQFSPLVEWAKQNRVVLDGEFNSNTYNTAGETRSILSGTKPTPEDFMFKIFYVIPYSVWNGVAQIKLGDLTEWVDMPGKRVQLVQQTAVGSAEEFEQVVANAKRLNLEGFILLNPRASYVHGRKALTRNPLRKYKYYGDDEDAKVIGLTERQERRAGTAGKTHITGYAKQVYTQDSFRGSDIAGCMVCKLEGSSDPINVPFPIGWGMDERRRAYTHFGTGSELDLKGEWLSFRRLRCEDRDKPVAIKKVQFRDRKD